MMKRIAALTAFVAVLGWSASSVAQQSTWLEDRRYREGAGFQVGKFELHPGIGADFGYDSNWFRRAESEDPAASLRLRVSPHFSVATRGPQRGDGGPAPRVRFRADLSATYNEFFPVSGSEISQESLQDQRDLAANAAMGLDILPGRPWSGRIFGGVGRVIRPADGYLDETFNRVLPRAGGELIWTPDAGLLDWRLGYAFNGTFYESSAFGGLNSFRNDITTRGRWRFVPKTALLFDAKFSFLTYPSGSEGATNKGDSHPLRTRIGLNGLFTRSFAVLALAGWGASFYSGGDEDFDSLIAQVEARWYLKPSATSDPRKVPATLPSLAFGFVRDFEDSLFGTYVEHDRGYGRFNYLIGGRFLFVAEAGAGALVFPLQTNPDLGNAGGWSDVRADGKLFGEYRLKDWLGLNLELSYVGYFSSTRIAWDLGSVTGIDQLGYQNFTAFLGARWFM
jgi:hypothetical protein